MMKFSEIYPLIKDKDFVVLDYYSDEPLDMFDGDRPVMKINATGHIIEVYISLE